MMLQQELFFRILDFFKSSPWGRFRWGLIYREIEEIIMNKEEQFIFWQNGLFNAIKNVSDIEWQKNIWAGKIPGYISSFTQVVCVLYDDFDFERYIEYLEQTNCDNELLELMKELDGLMSPYIDMTIDLNIEDDMQILIDNRWIEITNKAKHLYDLIKLKYNHKYNR